MARIPRIPTLPNELPSQRLNEVITLEDLPIHASVFVGYPGSVPYDAVPSRKPRSLIYLCQVEWAWSPMNSRIDAYYLHRSRGEWFLWLSYFDDNWERWEWNVVAGFPITGVSQRQAAVHLLLNFWQFDFNESEVDHFHWINEAAYLSVADVDSIARQVWGS